MQTFSWETNAAIEHLIEHPDDILPLYKEYKQGKDPFLSRTHIEPKLVFNRIAPIADWVKAHDLTMHQALMIIVIALQHEINMMMSELVAERLLDGDTARLIHSTSTLGEDSDS